MSDLDHTCCCGHPPTPPESAALFSHTHTLSYCHTLTLSHSHALTLSHSHSLTLQHCHPATGSASLFWCVSGYDIDGALLLLFNSSSAAECNSLCSSNPACQLCSYTGAGQCSLKAQLSLQQSAVHLNSSVLSTCIVVQPGGPRWEGWGVGGRAPQLQRAEHLHCGAARWGEMRWMAGV